MEWRVGYAEYSMQIGDTVKHGVKAVASLQGKTNTGIWLPEVKHDGQKAWIMHIVRPVNPQPDFTEMYGLGSGWLTDIMDGPGADDRKWRIDSPSAGVPGGLVVGYQLRTWGPVDAVRFLFQALPGGGGVEALVTIRHSPNGLGNLPGSSVPQCAAMRHVTPLHGVCKSAITMLHWYDLEHSCRRKPHCRAWLLIKECFKQLPPHLPEGLQPMRPWLAEM